MRFHAKKHALDTYMTKKGHVPHACEVQ